MRRGVPLIAGAAVLATGSLAASGPAAGGSTGQPPAALHADAAERTSPLDLVAARFGPTGRPSTLRVELRTALPYLRTVLVPGSGRSLCVELHPAGPPAGGERLCAVSDEAARTGLSLRLTRLGPSGAIASITKLDAVVLRPDGRTVVADVPLTKLHLRPGRHAWQAVSHWQDTGACRPVTPDVSPCADAVPDAGAFPLVIAPPRPVGCAFAGPRQVRGGTGKRIALTFDDGPAADTPRVLDILEREHVPATFFVVGRSVAGRAAVLRRMLADGDMIGNHSYTHADLRAGGGAAADELRRTQAAVRRETGFTPCLFRPPYGSTSPALVATAGAQGLTTVLWDDDPQDWRSPGAAAIRDGILRQARPGGIVVAHDGPGARGQTVAALPGVIHALRHRGYRLVTVTELLGLPLKTR